MKRRTSALVLVTIILGLPVATRAQSPPNPWIAITLLDLRGIHDILRDNHPGPVDPENPRYVKWLEDGLARASERALSVRTYSDYVRVLRFYTNGFQDGHLGVAFEIVPKYVRWPGFVIGPNDNGVAQVVYAEANAGVKQSDRLVSCDGKSVNELMKERVDPYYWNSAIPHQRASLFHLLFHIDPGDSANNLKTCQFSSGNVELKWRRLERAEFQKMLDAALGKGDSELSLKRVNGVWLVRVPTLAFPGAANVKKVRAFISDLQANVEGLRTSVVVFDVRGNHGGDSSWAEEIVSVVWGRDWLKYIGDGFDGTVEWRASPANIRWMETMLNRQTQAGLTESAAYIGRVVESMKAVFATGKALARVEDLPKAGRRPAQNPVTGRAYFLTDNECASACLDFADLMRRLPHVTHVGLPTSADAVYMDNTNADLPSGLGVLGYSLKVYRNRVRGNNQWYEPQVRWPGGLMTDEGITKWIRSLGNQ
jgi:hypothetical protein